MSPLPEPLLKISNLRVTYGRRRASVGRKPRETVAVDDVSLALIPGETLALVGESGSGKTTIGNAVLGLVTPTSGSIRLRGREIVGVGAQERRIIASELQAIFQNPYGSLNPSLKIGQILTEPLHPHGREERLSTRVRIRSLLDRVGLPEDSVDRYPGEFSGGERQRIAIARAIAIGPSLIVCDEPTSALDVSTQKSVLDLLDQLKSMNQLSYLFITHDLAVVRHFADRVAVLNHGRIVEVGTAQQVCEEPKDPYTQRLVEAAPVPDPRIQAARRAQRVASVTKGTAE
jgi:peptide/nickel transport system ATP-binding protein